VPVITVVYAPACHFCDDAQVALAELGREYPLRVELVDADSPRGMALVSEHRSPMFPLVLVDGRFFSYGRLPSRKLRRLLAREAVSAP
jgi:thiol-disulfide isomerase/thioredoxin